MQDFGSAATNNLRRELDTANELADTLLEQLQQQQEELRESREQRERHQQQQQILERQMRQLRALLQEVRDQTAVYAMQC